MADNTKVYIKFKRPNGISLPNGGVLSPALYPQTRVVDGFASPVPVQDYNKDEEYALELLPETPDPLPPHLDNLDPEIKKAFVVNQASSLAQNHTLNNQYRAALKAYEADGTIEVTHDTFVDGPKEGSDKKKGEGQWLLQDQNQNKRLEEGSLDRETDLEKRESDPNPYGFRQAVGSDANHQATYERNAEFGSHEGVPTNENPQPKKKGASKVVRPNTDSPTSTEEKAPTPGDATKGGSEPVNTKGTTPTDTELE